MHPGNKQRYSTVKNDNNVADVPNVTVIKVALSSKGHQPNLHVREDSGSGT